VVRSKGTLAFAAERQAVIQTKVMKVLRKAVGWVSVLLGAILFGWQVYLDDAYAARMPRSEDREAGRVVPLVVHHGSHIFVTPGEAETFAAAGRRLTFGWPLVMLGMAVAGADHLWERRNRMKSSRTDASAG
jgi:hypothetical protein